MGVAYKNQGITLYNQDCLVVLDELEENSVDMIFADPPYMLSNNGFTFLIMVLLVKMVKW